jgi:hypothetical protein
VDVVCEQQTSQQHENEMIEKKQNERNYWRLSNVAKHAQISTFSS